MDAAELISDSSAIRPAPIASKLHLIGLFLILFGTAGAGFLAQHRAVERARHPLNNWPTIAKPFVSILLPCLWIGRSSVTATRESAGGVVLLLRSQRADGGRRKAS